MLKKFRNILLSLLQIIIFVYLIILVFLYFYQRNLLYHPNENNYSGDKISVEIKKVKILTSDNIELLGWYHEKNLKDYKTLVFFHGNAGSLENRIHKLNHFKNMDLNFLIIAFLSSSVPSTAVYLVSPFLIALIAAFFMLSGVSKYGSPAPRPITSFPAALNSRAFCVTAIVGESLILFKLSDIMLIEI